MANSIVRLPVDYFSDPSSNRSLFNAKIYVGNPDTNPRIPANQKTVTGRQEDGTEVPLAQPIRTSAGGYPTYNGSVVELLVDGAYSMAVDDRVDTQVFYFANVLDGAPLTTDDFGPGAGQIPTNQIVIRTVDTISNLRSLEPLIDGQQVELLGHTVAGLGGDIFYADLSDTTSPDDNGVTIVTPGGRRWKRKKSVIELVDFGADPTGVNDSADAINAAHNVGLRVVDTTGGTFKFNSTIRLRSSFRGTARNYESGSTGRGTTLLKGNTSALVVHYPQFRVYEDYIIDADGSQTAFDVFYDSSSTFAGGIKYSVVSNVLCRNMTTRAFNLNGPLFGATLTNCRVLANKSDGTTDNVIAFYTAIEDSEGIGSQTTDTNAAFSLVTPNVYNRNNAANNVTFLQADYCRGYSAIGCEVAAARIMFGTQSDGYLQGAFEYINAHSPLFRSTIEIGGGSNIQTYREGATGWTSDSNVPFSSSDGRHIFRLDSDTNLTIGNISLFNQLGANSGTAGSFGLVACASGFTGNVNTSGITEYDQGGGGFVQQIQVASNSGEVAARTLIGNESFYQDFTQTIGSGASGTISLTPGGFGLSRFPIAKGAVVRESSLQLSQNASVSEITLRITTYNADGSVAGSTKDIATIPAASPSGTVVTSEDPLRTVPPGGSVAFTVVPTDATYGSNIQLKLVTRFN